MTPARAAALERLAAAATKWALEVDDATEREVIELTLELVSAVQALHALSSLPAFKAKGQSAAP
jgi:hypothetical protein